MLTKLVLSALLTLTAYSALAEKVQSVMASKLDLRMGAVSQDYVTSSVEH